MNTDSEWFSIEYQQWGDWHFASQHQTLEEAREALALDLRVMAEKIRRIVKHTVVA